MSLGESFTTLFGSANILTICLWVTGFVLFAVELFQPMRKILSVLGLLLISAAFATHMVHGSPGEAFMFILLTSVSLIVIHFVSLATQKRDWLHVSRMTRTAVRTDRYGSLVGSVGVANTAISFTGSVTVGDINLVVYSETPIPAGAHVRIITVSKDKITVIPIEEFMEQ